MFSRPKKAFKVQIIEQKNSKRIFKWIFEAHRLIVKKIIK